MMKDAPTTKKKLRSLMTGTCRQLASFPQLPQLLSTLNPRLSKMSAPLIPGQSSRLRLGLRVPTLTRNLLLRQVSTWTRRWMTVAPRICPAPAPGTCLMGPSVSTATSISIPCYAMYPLYSQPSPSPTLTKTTLSLAVPTVLFWPPPWREV